MKKLLISLLFGVAAGVAHAGTELVANGDFSTGTFAGWTKSGTNPDSRISNSFADDGHPQVWYAATFFNRGASALLSQDLATVAGGRYRVAFDVYSNTVLAPPASNFQLWFGAEQVVNSYHTDLGWTHFVIDNVAATSSRTTLTLGSSIDYDFGFVAFDNISVQAVPEPETYAMMVAGLGLLGLMHRRRKQRP